MDNAKVQAWRDAHHEAIAARVKLDRAFNAFFKGSGPRPDAEQIARTRELACVADRALGEAVRMLTANPKPV